MKLWQAQDIEIRKPSKHYEGIKIDVRRCGSGELILFKDPTLYRLCRKFITVRTTPFNKLKDTIKETTGKDLLTLKDAFERFSDVPFFIESRSHPFQDDNIEKGIADLLIRYFPNSEIRMTDNILTSDSLVSFCKLHYLFGDFKPAFFYKSKSRRGLGNLLSKLLLIQGVLLEDQKVSLSALNKWSHRQIGVAGISRADRIEALVSHGVEHVIVDASAGLFLD